LPRPRLHKLLGAIPRGGVVSVVAGPGYGKTALLSQALAQIDLPSAYLTLDPGDQDPARFLHFLLAAIAFAHPGVGEAAKERLEECRDPEREVLSVVAVLLAEVAAGASAPTTLAFDDLHSIEDSEPVIAALEFLLDGLPDSWTVLIASRHRLPFSLDHHRRRDRVIDIDVRRLRLTPREVAEWARMLWELHLDLPDARALWKLTQGWPVALVLMGRRLRDSPRATLRADVLALLRRGRSLNEYLATTVFHSLPADVALALTRATPIERIHFPRDEAFFGGEPGEAERLLKQLVAQGFLVTETGHRTFTLHPLVRAFAQQTARAVDESDYRELELQAARHLEARGAYSEAVSLFLAAGAPTEAVPALRALISHDLNVSMTRACKEWLESLPARAVVDEPWLLMARAQALQRAGEFREAEGLFRAAARLFGGQGDRAARLQALLAQVFCLYVGGRWDDALATLEAAHQVAGDRDQRAEVLVAEGTVLLSKCRWDGAVERFELALDTVPPAHRRDLEVRIDCHRARLFFLLGQYGTALSWAHRAVQLGVDGPRVSYASALNIAATALYLTGSYEEAARRAESALGLVRAWGYSFLEAPVLMTVAGAALGLGEIRRAYELLQRALEVSRAAADPEAEVWALDMVADLSRRNRNPLRAAEKHREALELIDRHQLAVFERTRVLCGLGMDLVVAGETTEGGTYLEEAVAFSRRWGFSAPLAQALFYLGWLHARRGDESAAAKALAESASIGQSNRQWHFFLQEARVALPVLSLSDRLQCGAFAQELEPLLPVKLASAFRYLAAGSVYPTDIELGAGSWSRFVLAQAVDPEPDAETQALTDRIAQLTEREIEILRMIGLGMSNKVIGAKLFITEKTIKTHANRVYRKLGVTNRLQAVLVLQQYQKREGAAAVRRARRR